MQRSVGFRPLHASLVILGVVFASELALMLTFDVLPPLPDLLEALVNAVVLLLILGGLLYVYVYKPMQQQIRDRDLAIASLRESEQRFQDIARAADEWIWEVDANGRYTYASPVVERVLGYTPEEVLSKHFYDLFHPDERETAKAEAFAVFAQKMPFHGFINRNRHKNGASVWLSTTGVPIIGESGELLGYRGADVLKFRESAVTDLLTGVLNRQGFALLAEQQMRMSARSELQVAILFADMDNLKQINDEHGHQTGDLAITKSAEILKSAVRESDVVARYGGDEFVVLLSAQDCREAAAIVREHVERRVAECNGSSELPHRLSISLGVAYGDRRPLPSLDDLIQEADRAMYRDKNRAARR